MFTFLFLYVCIVIAFNFLNLIQKKRYRRNNPPIPLNQISNYFPAAARVMSFAAKALSSLFAT